MSRNRLLEVGGMLTEQEVEEIHIYATNLEWRGDHRNKQMGELLKKLIKENEELLESPCECACTCDSVESDDYED